MAVARAAPKRRASLSSSPASAAASSWRPSWASASASCERHGRAVGLISPHSACARPPFWKCATASGPAVGRAQRLPDRRGGLGNVFQQVFDLEGGSKHIFDYDLDGRIASKTKASGSMAVKATETDPAGAIASTCETGPFTWSANSG
jgi:hypothetical protein